MMIDLSKTLGTLVEEVPGASRILERFGLDYCCGGKRSLQDACRQRGLDTQDVAQALQTGLSNNTPPPIDWSQRSLSQLADHIENTHHRFTRDELLRLEPLLDKVCRKHGEAHPELHEVKRLVHALACDLRPHMTKEEQVLFMAIRAQEAGQPIFSSLWAPVQVMMAEHKAVGDILHALRQTTGGYVPPTGACPSYCALYDGLQTLEADLHIHIHLENNVLFPRTNPPHRLDGQLGN